MLQEMVHSQDHQNQQLPIDEISSPLGDQLLEFCESELFPETLQNSEVTSTSNNNCSYEDQSSYQFDTNNYNNEISINPPAPPITATDSTTPTDGDGPQTNNFSIIFDDDQLENDISASIDFTPSPSFSAPHHNQYYNNNNNDNNNNNQELFNISSLNNHLSINDHHMMNEYGPSSERWSMQPPVVGPPPLPTSYEDECLSYVPSYIRLRPSQPACSLMDTMMPPFLPPCNMNNTSFSAEMFAGINGGLMLENGLTHQDLDFEGDSGGLFLPDNLPTVFNCSSEFQTLSNESQLVVHGGTNTSNLASEISSLDDPMFKVGKLSAEERKRKIDRYMQKRNERNFSKKIKYACRKTLADSRPRVRGRFAKNDELARTTSSNHEDDTDDDVSLFSNSLSDHQRKVGVKEEEDLDSADICAHITGVNSFKCNYPIQSWI
ncbi:hypothetical protein CASFOL_005141 [Castilleja foliolosa]|uniref:CCT domain-containing protein n=1 Tax=Castilleja foliolosa TaxID=1961234 RepID=A0ABD3E2X9_9LAMI